jgi:hypothetical protein
MKHLNRTETIEPDTVEYYRERESALRHWWFCAIYRYGVSKGKWSYWDKRHFKDACWVYYDLTEKEAQVLKKKIPRASKLEILLVCGPSAVRE